MRSRASFKAHPIHPALIPFPFAFLFGSLAFDLLGLTADRPAFWLTGGHLTVAGVVAGLLAAVPGAIDYRATVPPRSSGRRRALTHAIGNVIALALFAFSWLLRAPNWSPTGVSIAFSLAGAVVLAYSGWLGGTLVTRNMISVDHRYAGAGKWREEVFSAAEGQSLVVAKAGDLKVDQMKLLHINGRRIVLARTKDGMRAFDDGCTHRGGSLAGGVMVGGTVQCLWHGSQFDADTGDVRCGPAKRGVKTYEVSEDKNGTVSLTVPKK